jgi:hypothetical protein
MFWVKILKFFDTDPGSGMEKFGSGMEKVGSGINIPDPQHWSQPSKQEGSVIFSRIAGSFYAQGSVQSILFEIQ